MKNGVLIGCGLAGLIGVVLCGGILTLVAGGVGALFSMTQPVADGASDFLALVGQGNSPEAYASAGGKLRAESDEAAFTAAVRQLGLTGYVSASWTRRCIENQSGSVEGMVTTTGGTAPAKVELVYEQGKWCVVGIRYAGRDLADSMRRTARPTRSCAAWPRKPWTNPRPSRSGQGFHRMARQNLRQMAPAGHHPGIAGEFPIAYRRGDRHGPRQGLRAPVRSPADDRPSGTACS